MSDNADKDSQGDLENKAVDDEVTAVRDFYDRIVSYEWIRLDRYVFEFSVVRHYLAGSRAIPLASSYGDESAVAVATPYLLLTAFYLW